MITRHLNYILISRTGGATSSQFPFGFVQLGTNAEQKTDNSPDSSWPLIRWHQTADHGVAPNMYDIKCIKTLWWNHGFQEDESHLHVCSNGHS